ncbi:MAG: hypothetical protein MSC45_04075 [Mobiluncus sp.]|uniref:Uncharacterized protein n=1 Tax=Mobiluncus porci TaxID=2652278 RepID=A0A7K0K1N3_9ACTO|nr:hypothetical protein [Mobiluncus sp.]MCI6584231.1 hypothetical protein [Mobiluncus sp.]MST49397.1 hypothetical protein [Mobiluncus porci]
MNSGFGIKLDERELEKAVRSKVSEVVRDLQKQLDSLLEQYRGKPVSMIRPRLKEIFAGNGGSISSEELDDYSQAISEGTRIELKL